MASGTSHQFVFVSHANKDKALIRAVVQALIAADLKIWLDNPSALGFSAQDIEAHFIDLRGGAQWDDQIDNALDAATCVLLCVSKNFVDRFADDSGPKGSIVRNEVTVGLRGRRAVVCRIDDVPYERIPKQLGFEQVVDLHATPGKLGGLVADVRRKIEQVVRARAGNLRAPRDPFQPYLIDRNRQEALAGKAIETASQDKVCAMFVQGPQNECLDQFCERLRKHTSARYNASEGAWIEHVVEWPLEHPRRFAEAYELGLAAALGQRRENIGAALANNHRAPVAVISRLAMTDWVRGQRERLLEWLRYWRGVSGGVRDTRIVPVLAVRLPEARPGWKVVPPAREDGVSAKGIWNDVAFAAQRAEKDRKLVKLLRLDVLQPVTEDHALNWLRDTIPGTGGEEWRRFEQEIGRTFRNGDKKIRQVALRDFANRMLPLFDEGR